jgi:hypothetical protein
MCEFLTFKLDFGARSCVYTKVYNLEYNFQGMDVDGYVTSIKNPNIG